MHKSQGELCAQIEAAKDLVVIGAEYVHFKSPNMRYVIKDLAINTDNTSVWVVYQALYGDGIVFTRSLDEWCESVEVNQKTIQRFTRVI